MKKRRLLALPKSPDASQDTHVQLPPEQQEAKQSHEDPASSHVPTVSAIDDGAVEVVDPTPPTTTHSMLRHLYEKGSGEDWLQLAWMRVRVTSSEEYEVQLPEVSCRLDELVRLPQDPPNCASYESTHDMHPSSANDAHSTSAQNVEGSDEIYRDAFQRIRNWLLGKSMRGGDPWPAAAPSMQECDWAILLDLFSSTDVPISKLATLLAQLAPCIGLLEQLWQRGDLVVALLQHHLEQHHDVDALLTSWMDCDWILKVPAKDFRASVRHMKLRDHLGEAVGSRLETDMIRVFHLQRGVHAKRQ